MWPIVKILSMSNCSIGSIIRAASHAQAGHGGDFEIDRTADRRQRVFLPEATPADRITLTTPAVKPSSKNTISPHGDVDSKRSNPQPMTAPTITPATNSDESRKPS